MTAKWSHRWPPTNTALDFTNEHVQRKARWRRLRAIVRRVSPRLVRRVVADLEPLRRRNGS